MSVNWLVFSLKKIDLHSYDLKCHDNNDDVNDVDGNKH